MTLSRLAQLGALLAKVEAAADHLRSPLLLALRLYFGWGFFQAGKGKLLHLERTSEFFASLGLPAPGAQAVLAGGTEALGGALLLVGLFSRLAAIPLAFTMLVAYGTAHRDVLGAALRNPDGVVEAPPFLFLLTALVILAVGPGKLSLDAWLRGRAGAATTNKT